MGNGINRRRFLQRMAWLGGGSALLATQNQFRLLNAALAAPGKYANLTDHRSLVCVFLMGGNDSHNMFVPYANAEYQKYKKVRQGMAIARSQLHPVRGSQYAFHSNLKGLRDLYNEGRLAIVNNIGPLFGEITPTAYFDFLEGNNAGLNVPRNLFSHSDQQETWQTGKSTGAGKIHPGWGGKMADRLMAANTNPAVPISYTLSGNNPWQAGVVSHPFGIQPGQGVGSFEDFDQREWPPWQKSRAAAWDAILKLQSSHLLQQQAAASFLNTRKRANLLRNALEQSPPLQTPYNPENNLAQQLRTIAKLIAARESLGLKRQIFFASLGSFDTHSMQLTEHQNLFTSLNDALVSFQRTLEELNVEDSVTTFTASEFGRTLTINGDGTDHAWACDLLVMGGAVDGGKVHGEPIEYSDQSLGEHWGEKLFGPRDVGSGRFIPKYSTDQYGATLAKWMGITDGDLIKIFPHLNNFSTRDLGFMNG
ncbi:MAG: hypothetical protein AXA67_12920 [Methylothermaceae bacteria B42]|nr:MAG: hypothetical protein AXA67_12920 [Methylothermaceae bacteria B42]HHJ38474.1 DUF1501 domain-containing protein [Methylothermaceae bacterium]